MKQMEYYRQPERDIPVIGRYDVVVVGGGCAGFAAAVAAARNGAKTLILERFPFFGGTATASLMANIVGMRNQVEPNELQVCRGIGEELILNLLECGGATVTQNAYPASGRPRTSTKGDMAYSYAFDTERFKHVTLNMALDAGVNILFHVYFSDVIMEGSQVTGVVFEGKSGRQAVRADVVIDASGDGDVAARAGVPFWQIRHDEGKRLNDSLMIKVRGFDRGNIRTSGCVCGEDMIIWGPKICFHDGADTQELTQIEIEARKDVYTFMEEFKKEHEDMKDAWIADTGCLMGIRQTRFIEGVYQISGDDVLSGARFEDVVALASNPVIDYFGYRRFLTCEAYDIPYRCMLPKEVDGLLVAGRCMSSDQIAYESWRAMAHVLCIGEAAGTAAALSVRAKVSPRNVDIPQLQAQLIRQGAEIGQNRTL